MRRRSALSVLGATAVLAAAALLASACGSADEGAKPSPGVVATADAISREVKFEAPIDPAANGSTGTLLLDGHVFGSGPTGIVLAHTRPVDQTGWFQFATSAAATGRFTLLTFDFRGYGASGGEKEFDRLDTDLLAALTYMRQTLKIDRIFLVGASMGGTASLVLAAREQVAGVVSISSPAQFESLDALDAEPHITVPELFVASQDDVPQRRSLEEFVKAAKHPVEQHVYDGDAHGTDLFASPHAADLTQRLIAFLSAH